MRVSKAVGICAILLPIAQGMHMIENELKYIARWQADLENTLIKTYGYTIIEQAYLNDRARIRKKTPSNSAESLYIFTYKQRLPTGRNLEIETQITIAEYDALYAYTSNELIKTRVTVPQGNIVWDIDFPHWRHGRHFFIAEAEMPETMDSPNCILPCLQTHIVYAVPRSDRRFTARRLSDEKHAISLAKELGLR